MEESGHLCRLRRGVDNKKVWPYSYGMKKMTAKGTYSLDPLTVLELRELATTWGVGQSEVIRRAVHAARQQKEQLGGRPTTAAEALNRLQQASRLTPVQRAAWIAAVRDERHGSRRP